MQTKKHKKGDDFYYLAAILISFRYIYLISEIKVVKTINQNVITDGFLSREITWDGKDDFGDKIGKGTYIYKLKVKSTTTNHTENLKDLDAEIIVNPFSIISLEIILFSSSEVFSI